MGAEYPYDEGEIANVRGNVFVSPLSLADTPFLFYLFMLF